MKKILAALLCFVFPACAFAGDNGYEIGYDGGSIQGYKSGTDIKLFIDGSGVRIMKDTTLVALLPATAITEISYGQDVHRRVGAAIGVAIFSMALGLCWRKQNPKSTSSASLGTIAERKAGAHSRRIRMNIAAC